jgi:hypothetical protein
LVESFNEKEAAEKNKERTRSMRRTEILDVWKKKDIALQKRSWKKHCAVVVCSVCCLCHVVISVTFITSGDWLPKISLRLLHLIKLDTVMFGMRTELKEVNRHRKVNSYKTMYIVHKLHPYTTFLL